MASHPQNGTTVDADPPAAPAGPVRKFAPESDAYRWADVPLKTYKPEGTHFLDITRQTLFGEPEHLASELRYFEIAPGGHSTLERHAHVHAVVLLRGRGHVLVGNEVFAVEAFDLVHVPPFTWHQFRADEDVPLGFLCLVDCDRDRPQRPTPEEAEALRALPVVGDFIRV